MTYPFLLRKSNNIDRGNKFAITSRGIGEALRLSASALNEGGNSLDESIALITAANEVVNDPSSVGTALKTLTLRLRGSKTQLEEMGEDVTDMATTTSQLQAKLLALTGGQVDIMLNETTFKNSTQILREMAEAWDDMNDIQRASALELMGGKRQANVLSALIQNFDTVESAIEASANSAGSALKENERYLDSIQGKIDQFNNALQAMWSNALDSDVVKWFVNLGTELIKIVDKIGLLNSALLALGAYKGIGALFKMFKSSAIPLKVIWQYINQLTVGFKGFSLAQMKSQAATAAGTLANSQYSASLVRTNLIQWLTKGSTEALEAAKYKLWLAEKGLAIGIATEADVQAAQAAVTAASVPVDYAKMTTVELLGLGFNKLTASIIATTKAVVAFLFTNPVGWLILAVGAISTGIAVFNHFHKTTEELTEELNELKNELQDVKSEIETVNSELETMEDRIAELLAKDSLSFVEQEELDRLQKENNELQRRLDLLKEEDKVKAKETSEKFVQTMESYGNKTYRRGGEVGWITQLFLPDKSYAISQDEYISRLMEEYDKVLKVDSGELDRSVLVDEMSSDWYSKRLGEEINALVEAADGVEYYVGDYLTDQQKEVNEWLDYVYNTQDKLAIMRNGENAKTNALNRIFDKDENDAVSESIDGYVEALRNGDTNAKSSIKNIIKNNKALVEDLELSGLSIEDAVDHFTSFASSANYATIEGKVKEMESATIRLNAAFENFKMSTLGEIQQALTDKGWVDAEGGLISDAIAEYFGGDNGGISEETRSEIERLVQQIYDGKISVEHALKQFEYFGIESTLDIYVTEVQTNFKNVFPELENADGLIDTFEELGEAIGSTADALKAFNKAEAEMANSGRVSIQTALELMEYTDDYGSILHVVDGKLQLVDNAEEALIQTRINAIRTSAEASLADATNAYSKAQLATQTYKDALTTDMSAEVVAKSWEKVLAAGAGLVAGIKSLFTSESWTDAYNSAYEKTLSEMTGYETEYTDTGLQALVDAEEDAKAAMQAASDRVNLANQLTPETLEAINDADDVDSVEEVKDDAFQREMNYWQNRIAANQARYEQLQNEIDLLETKGQKADASYYQEQAELEAQRLELLEGQKAAANAYLGTLTEGSEEWWDVANTLNDLESDIDDVTASLVDLQDAIAEIDTYKFEEFNTRLDNLIGKLDTIRNLIAPDGEESWFDDEGNWTEDGVAVLGSYVQELEFYKQGYQDTMDELAKYEPDYESNKSYYESLGIHSEQEYYCGLYLNQQYVLCGNA